MENTKPKRIIALFLCACLLLGLCACGETKENPKPADPPKKEYPVPEAGPAYVIGYMEDRSFKDDEEIAFISRTDQLYIVSKGYDNLKNSLKDLNTVLYNDYYDSFKDARQYIDENPDLPADVFPLEKDMNISIERDDSFVFSFVGMDLEYLGGPHPSYYMKGYNFDTQTGAKLALDDVITDRAALTELVISLLKDRNETEFENGFYDDWEKTARDLLAGDFNWWTCSPEGLYLWINEYEIAPHAAGAVDVVITAKDNPDLFTEKYYPGGEKTPKPLTEDAYANATYLYKTFVPKVVEGFGTMSYEECCNAIVNDATVAEYDIEYTEPWSTESSGDIHIVDKENDCTIRIFFWPDTKENGEYDFDGPVHANEIWYRNNDYCALLSYSEFIAESQFQFIDYGIYENVNVDTPEDLALLMFNSGLVK